ncbi:hypothetical protein LCGC14_0292990 [marine sediment metagenome]|uniref:ROK family protein n=1 Tax=marine sediment metagenome TaxID=412755 RepID=A0A0F9U9S0_9ZZZZ
MNFVNKPQKNKTITSLLVIGSGIQTIDVTDFVGKNDEISICVFVEIANYVSDYFFISSREETFWDTPKLIWTEGVPPEIIINSPTQLEVFGFDLPDFNITINNPFPIDTAWYTLDSISNYNFSGTTGTIDQLVWDNSETGTVTITFFVNDSVGNLGFKSINLEKDYFNFITPLKNQGFGLVAPDFNITINGEVHVDSKWYTIDSGLTNYTFIGTAGSTDQSAWDAKGNGPITILFYANNSLGNIGSDSIDVIKDTESPIIVINSPTNQQLCGVNSPSFDLQINELQLHNTWYSFNDGQNITFTTETQFNQAAWDLQANGTVLIRFYAEDEVGHFNSSQVMVRKDAIIPDITIISPIFKEEFGIGVALQNDANACALAEWMMGSGVGTENMIFLTFGTGMGAGLILNGKIYSGASDLGGEVGHLRLSDDGPIGFGKAGSFEGFCSGGGIAQLAKNTIKDKLENNNIVGFCTSLEDIDAITAKSVFTAALQGDQIALDIVKISAEYLGKALAILIDTLNPECIVIGSIYARNEALLKPLVYDVLEKETIPAALEVCRILPAKLGDKIGDYAALGVAMQ